MDKKEKEKIIEKFRKKLNLFSTEESKNSFHKVYKNLSDEAIEDLKNA